MKTINEMVQVSIRFKGSTHLMSFEENESIRALKLRLRELTHLPSNQTRLEIQAATGRRIVLQDQSLLRDYQEHFKNDVVEVTVKDLGSQVAYNALFYIEYCFPPLSTLAFYLFNKGWHSKYHKWLTACILFHFGKRLLETKFVHIFSNTSVPFKVLIRNCIHYWALVGLLLPIEVFHLRKMKLPAVLSKSRLSLLVLFLVFEFLNFVCHLRLRRMRERKDVNGNTVIVMDRSVPKGLFFSSIVSPNYTFEILAWATFSAFFRTLVGAGFTVLSAGIMANWALQKKKKLLELEGLTDEEKRKIRRRWACLPFII
jgi:very-long-chain enoyl-CoA reductase